ncbi:Uncharacterised protein [uncultured archaeon]|nr:Uncharacterised protein [uncultured archaeon]
MNQRYNHFLLTSFYASLEETFHIFEKEKFRFCSLEDIAMIRSTSLDDKINFAGFCYEGNVLMNEGILCLPGNPPKAKLIKKSTLLHPETEYIPEKGIVIGLPRITKNIEDKSSLSGAEYLQRVKREFEISNFYPTKEQIIRAVKESVNFPVGEENQIISILAKDFDKDELTVFAFGGKKTAAGYGRELIKSGLNEIIIKPEDREVINMFEKPFVKQILYGMDKKTLTMQLSSTFLFLKSGHNIYGVKEIK